MWDLAIRSLVEPWNERELRGVEAGVSVRVFEGHRRTVEALCLNQERTRALSAFHTVKLWDTGTGRPMRTFDGGPDADRVERPSER